MPFGAEPLAAAASQSLIRFGQRTRTVDSNVFVNSIRFRIVQNNPNRVELTLQNLATSAFFVGVDPFQVANGLSLQIPPGGGVTVLVEEDGEMVAWDWWASVTINNGNIYISEVIAD